MEFDSLVTEIFRVIASEEFHGKFQENSAFPLGLGKKIELLTLS